MLGSGVPLPKALRVAGAAAPAPLRQASERMASEVERGVALPGLMRREEVFPAYVCGLAEAGYAHGRLDLALRSAADRVAADVALARRAVQALAYPALVLAVVLAVAMIVSFVAVPAFEGMYVAAGKSLPWPTRTVVGTARFLRAYWPFLVVGAVACAVWWKSARRTGEAERLAVAVGKVPVLGPILRDIRAARLLALLESLHGAGLVMTRCIEVAAMSMPQDPAVRSGMSVARSIVESGRSVTEALRASRLFPEDALEMVRAGEESGRLGACMADASRHLQARADHGIRVLSAFVEPAAALLVGGIAAGVAFALYLPVFEIPSLVFGR